VFDKFVEGLLRRMEAIRYSSLDSGSVVEEEVNAVNFRFGSDRGGSRVVDTFMVVGVVAVAEGDSRIIHIQVGEVVLPRTIKS
jgi:hypothetical protein